MIIVKDDLAVNQAAFSKFIGQCTARSLAKKFKVDQPSAACPALCPGFKARGLYNNGEWISGLAVISK